MSLIVKSTFLHTSGTMYRKYYYPLDILSLSVSLLDRHGISHDIRRLLFDVAQAGTYVAEIFSS